MAIVKPGGTNNPLESMSDKRISDKILQYLNKQIQVEAIASQTYLALSQWCKDIGYVGSGKWFETHSDEERKHMKLVYEYILDRDELPATPEIPAPKKQNFSTLLEVFEAAYEHEKMVTSTYNKLVSLCNEEKDFMTLEFALFFLKEQKEEEAKTKGYIDELKLSGNDKYGAFLFDKEIMD
jgi:ferritin